MAFFNEPTNEISLGQAPSWIFELGPAACCLLVQLCFGLQPTVRGPMSWTTLGYMDQAATMSTMLVTTWLWTWTVYMPQRLLWQWPEATPDTLWRQVYRFRPTEIIGQVLTGAAMVGAQVGRASFFDYTAAGIISSCIVFAAWIALLMVTRLLCLQQVERHFQTSTAFRSDPSFRTASRRLAWLVVLHILCFICHLAIVLDDRNPTIHRFDEPRRYALASDRQALCAHINATYATRYCPGMQWGGSIESTVVPYWDRKKKLCSDGNAYAPYFSQLDACFTFLHLEVAQSREIALLGISYLLAYAGFRVAVEGARPAHVMRRVWLDVRVGGSSPQPLGPLHLPYRWGYPFSSLSRAAGPILARAGRRLCHPPHPRPMRIAVHRMRPLWDRRQRNH